MSLVFHGPLFAFMATALIQAQTVPHPGDHDLQPLGWGSEDPWQCQVGNKGQSKCNALSCPGAILPPPLARGELSPVKLVPGAKSRLHWSALFGQIFTGCFPGGSDGKESACSAEDPVSIPRSGRPLEEGMITHSSIPAWRIPWAEEPGGLQSTGSQKSWTYQQLTLWLLSEFLVCLLTSPTSTLLTASQGSVKHAEFVHLVKMASCRLH